MLTSLRKELGAILILLPPVLGSCQSHHDSTISLDPNEYPFVFQQQDSLGGKWRFADLDGDAVDELINVRAGMERNLSLVLIGKYGGATLGQINLPPTQSVEFYFADDVNGDVMKELFIATREGSSLFAYIIDVSPQNILKKFPLVLNTRIRKNIPKDYGAQPIRIIGRRKGGSANPRGSPNLLLCLFTTSSLESGFPRGIAAFDIETGKQAWAFPIGAWPNLPVVADIDEDGGSEIFLTATAPGNGFSANGFDDYHSYLIALSATGKKLWSKTLGGVFSAAHATLRDINRDGKEDLIVLFTSRNRVVERSYIAIFDPRTGGELIPRTYFDEPLSTTSPVILQHRREDFIVVFTHGGKVVLLDHLLKEVSVRQFPFPVQNVNSFGVDEGNRKYIAVALANARTAIIDEQFEPVTLISGTNHITMRQLAPQKPYVIIHYGSGVSIGTLESVMPAYVRWIRWIGIGLFAAIILTAAVFGSLRLLFYLRLFLTISRGAHHLAAMVLNRNGKILHANDALLQMFGIPSDDYRSKPWMNVFVAPQHRPVVQALRDAIPVRKSWESEIPFHRDHTEVNLLFKIQPITVGGLYLGSLVIFDDITQAIRTERAINWGLVAQNLAHEMKTPLSTIWFTLERIKQKIGARESGGDFDQYMTSIAEEIRRLDGYVKGLLKLANLNPPNLQPAELNDVLSGIIRPYLSKLPQTATIETNLGENLPNVKIDVHLFTVAVTNLLDNGVAAMDGKGTLRVSTYLAQNLSSTSVCLAIADTGRGIRQEDLPKIFTPYFSRSAGGTGLGLIITKKIVEDHGGTVSFTTKEGFGTEFVIQLPVPAAAAGVDHA